MLWRWLCSNEAKHRERFAVRAKHMTLDPAGNRYIKYIRNIRAIQVLMCSTICMHAPLTVLARVPLAMRFPSNEHAPLLELDNSGLLHVALQDYLVRRADRHSIPKVDNTNVDRSVATIHATLTGALRRREQVKPKP